MARLGFLALALTISSPAGAQDSPRILPVEARPIDHFEVGSEETKFGSLEFLGGLELISPSRDLGAMSAIRVAEDGRSVLGVMDTGNWFEARIERSADGRVSGLSDFTLTAMRDASGDQDGPKWSVDAEGLALRGEEAFVSFERDARIDVFDRADLNAPPARTLDILIPRAEIRGNRGLEAVAIAPDGSPLQGAAVTISERSLNEAGDIFAAILEGPRKGLFFVHRDPPFDVTDAAFLPGGDLLLLERRFNIAGGIGMRIRRISADAIRPDATVDGKVLIEADFGDQIDNMEGLDVVEDADGSVRLLLVSDDNHSILQRNLLLEFRLSD
jgi:hypothetical protein